MFQLLSTELGNIGGQRRIVVAQFIQLPLVVPVNFSLHRFGAGHCGFLADQGSSCAKREARDMPEGL